MSSITTSGATESSTSLFESDWEANGLLYILIATLPCVGLAASCVVYLCAVKVWCKIEQNSSPYGRGGVHPTASPYYQMLDTQTNAIQVEIQRRQAMQIQQQYEKEQDLLNARLQQMHLQDEQVRQIQAAQQHMQNMQQISMAEIRATQGKKLFQQNLSRMQNMGNAMTDQSKARLVALALQHANREMKEMAVKQAEQGRNKLMEKLDEIDVNYGAITAEAVKYTEEAQPVYEYEYYDTDPAIQGQDPNMYQGFIGNNEQNVFQASGQAQDQNLYQGFVGVPEQNVYQTSGQGQDQDKMYQGFVCKPDQNVYMNSGQAQGQNVYQGFVGQSDNVYQTTAGEQPNEYQGYDGDQPPNQGEKKGRRRKTHQYASLPGSSTKKKRPRGKPGKTAYDPDATNIDESIYIGTAYEKQ